MFVFAAANKCLTESANFWLPRRLELLNYNTHTHRCPIPISFAI